MAHQPWRFRWPFDNGTLNLTGIFHFVSPWENTKIASSSLHWRNQNHVERTGSHEQEKYVNFSLILLKIKILYAEITF